ncbi:hypothetical protein PoB_006622200 [Plakobranchus ocellatus]|uniref:Uncharacterized protein n=1 Tax=Plakobranchus ocellatus TaxID=259542 RepID=A0AAV4D6E7_9GAST|nr:hypothetical protein PoB_006622200 [Plakobranchus ocellatus]
MQYDGFLFNKRTLEEASDFGAQFKQTFDDIATQIQSPLGKKETLFRCPISFRHNARGKAYLILEHFWTMRRSRCGRVSFGSH